ncbi:hypothetical protein JEG41_11245, partial [Streptococcus agalactiae]|nr:hypothetical protein [Streptococcus agalactiae]
SFLCLLKQIITHKVLSTFIVYIQARDVHDNIRKLVLSVFGKTQNRKLLEEEYDQALELYKELKEWFVSNYDKRLEGLVLEDD